jgi:predicted dehydrogenase
VRSEPGAYPRFYAGVAEALATGAPPPVTAAEAVAMMDVLEAARVSARERRIVALTPGSGAGTSVAGGRRPA